MVPHRNEQKAAQKDTPSPIQAKFQPGPATSWPCRATGGKSRANPPGLTSQAVSPSQGLISSSFGERRHWKGQPAATPWLRVQTLGITQPSPEQ